MPAQPANHAGAAGHAIGAADAGAAGHAPDAAVLPRQTLPSWPAQGRPPPPTHPPVRGRRGRAATNTVLHPLHPLCKISYTKYPPTKAKRAPTPLLQKFAKLFV